MSPRWMRSVRPVAVLVVLVFALGPFADVPAGPPSTKPNIVVIMTDDQTVEQLRVMSATRSLVGDAGARFTNSFSSFPLCCPSRATFFSGQYAHNHGVLENEEPLGGYYRFNSANALPVWLQRAGYRTIHVGKYLNDYGTKDPAEIPPGWDEWYATIDPSTYHMWGYQMNENGVLRTYGDENVEDPALYQTDVLRRKAVDVIHRVADDGPFFLTLWTLAPHQEVNALLDRLGPRAAPRHKGAFANEPLPRPPSFNEQDMSDKALFLRLNPLLDDAAIAEIETRYRDELASLLAVDEAVSGVVDALRRAGVLRNTYVIFTSDNGYFHGEHRRPTEKILGYEETARVPLLMRGPGFEPGTVVDELVANVDLAPTIVELAGAQPGIAMDGRSLLPFVGDGTRRTARPILLEASFPLGGALAFFTEQLPSGAVVPAAEGGAQPTQGPELPFNQMVVPYQAVRTERYVYIEWATLERELYDLAVDPWQLESKHLDPAYAQTQIALLVALARLRLCAGEACRAETGPIPDPG